MKSGCKSFCKRAMPSSKQMQVKNGKTHLRFNALLNTFKARSQSSAPFWQSGSPFAEKEASLPTLFSGFTTAYAFGWALLAL
jgi:hypothetical protein